MPKIQLQTRGRPYQCKNCKKVNEVVFIRDVLEVGEPPSLITSGEVECINCGHLVGNLKVELI